MGDLVIDRDAFQKRFCFILCPSKTPMHPIRKLVLNARYVAERSKRRQCIHEMSERNEAPISVLFFHRVADCHPNDWTISTTDFQRSIDYCREHFEIISLAEVQNRLQTRVSPRPAVAITFDDGYAENSQFAIPYLVANRIPCTYFATTNHIRDGHPFPHDVAQGQPLAIDTAEQLRAVADAGIEIGVHSATHADFNRLIHRDELETEIIQAKADLEEMIDRPVSYLAVPYGLPAQMRPAVFELSRQCGLLGVCSAYGAYNLVGDDPYHIRRIHGDPDFIRMKNWLSFDSRKVTSAPSLPQNDVFVELNHNCPSCAPVYS